jgi:hypothetical protein
VLLFKSVSTNTKLLIAKSVWDLYFESIKEQLKKPWITQFFTISNYAMKTMLTLPLTRNRCPLLRTSWSRPVSEATTEIRPRRCRHCRGRRRWQDDPEVINCNVEWIERKKERKKERNQIIWLIRFFSFKKYPKHHWNLRPVSYAISN